ncbi:hypothetical protein SANTM175S_01681 [Streptomyces antimycoticus]
MTSATHQGPKLLESLNQRARAAAHQRPRAPVDSCSATGGFDPGVLAGATRHQGDEAGVQQYVRTGVTEFEDAALALCVHGRQLGSGHGTHAHP